jgi:hypothetical protein
VDGEVKYDVLVTREDGLWVADIRGGSLGPAATDTERFADLDVEVRDLIAGLTQSDPESFGLTWRYVIDSRDVTSLLEAVFGAEIAYKAAAEARDIARRALIRTLDRADVPQSAIGDLLGLSHQRISQLLKVS